MEGQGSFLTIWLTQGVDRHPAALSICVGGMTMVARVGRSCNCHISQSLKRCLPVLLGWNTKSSDIGILDKEKWS